MDKDEAIHKALKVLNCLNNDRVYETAWVKGAINACEEALEQQEVGDAEIKQMLNDIEYYQKRVEALEQPAQAITEGSQLSNIKAGSQSEKPSSPPAPKHTCTYSRTMNQEYPRKCIHCGEVEALAQPVCRKCGKPTQKGECFYGCRQEQPAQEPVGWLSAGHIFTENVEQANHWVECGGLATKLYTHPVPSWQGLSDEEKISIKRQINNAFNEGFEKGKAMSLVASIPPNFIKLEGMEKKKTHPSWQGLSDDEVNNIYPCAEGVHDFRDIVRAIEQALKEKNT
jgi:hypothetical protein